MSPKLRTRQPRRRQSALGVNAVGEAPPEGLFWVRVTEPENIAHLRPGQHLMLQVGEDSVKVLRGLSLLGVLESAGDRWVRSRGHSSCVFVKYGEDPIKRFQVRIAAR